MGILKGLNSLHLHVNDRKQKPRGRGERKIMAGGIVRVESQGV